MKRIFLFACLLWLLSSCAAPTTAAPVATFTPPQLPYYPSATPSPQPSPTPDASPTPLPSPTPTPRTHVLQNGQDLFGLSLYYNVTVNDILAVNPGLNPNAMRVGTVIILPPGSDEVNPPQPTSTPMPLVLDPPDCYLSADGSALCIVLAHNPLETRIEAVSAVVRLQSGGELLSQNAFLLLDGIPAGASVPLMAFFAGPLQAPLAANAELQTAIPLNSEDTRHIPLQSSPPQVNIAADGLSAVVSGTLSPEAGTASRIWVLAVAYNAQDRPVGLRRWESPAPPAQDFTLTVYSSVDAITRVEILVEALR